jgi:hypothetical protein
LSSSTDGLRALPLVIADPRNERHSIFSDVLEPYLNQMGIAYELLEQAAGPLSGAELSQWPLIILAHPGCLSGQDELASAVVRAVEAGTGLVSFGEQIAPWAHSYAGSEASTFVAIRDADHPICRLHRQGERRRHYHLNKDISPAISSSAPPLVTLGSGPLLSIVEAAGQGRVAIWSTLEWGRGDVLGPMYGMDDLLWRSIVWAARKPFVTRSLPPFLTMRIDDVSGFGRLKGGATGLYWLRDCVDLGWKPWVGLFLDDLTPDVLDELRPMLRQNQVKACPHAFSYWDFGYFRHTPKYPDQGYWSEAAACEPYTESEVLDRVRRVEAWYAKHPDIPMSKVFVPHYYELSEGFMPHLARWGCEFICSMNPENTPYPGTMTFGGPYYKKSTPATRTTPVFYADWYPAKEEQYRKSLFASITEIRDDNGYEWAPNNKVDDTIQHGINQISRALDAQVLAQLFTHESGYIQYIKPDHWKAIMEAITDTFAARGVIHTTLDEAMAYMRDLHESRLIGAACVDGELEVRFEGTSAGQTKIAVYADDTLEPVWREIRPFNGTHRETLPAGK